jgi:hypothetical protein
MKVFPVQMRNQAVRRLTWETRRMRRRRVGVAVAQAVHTTVTAVVVAKVDEGRHRDCRLIAFATIAVIEPSCSG